MSADAGDPRPAVRERYLAVDTSNVADVLDDMGLLDQGLHAGFAPLAAGGTKLAGWAYTIVGETASYPIAEKDPRKMAVVGAIDADSVAVWSGGAAGICLFGELIAIGMRERGCVGALVDGGARDLRWIDELDFPVYGRHRTPIQSIGRWRVTGGQQPVLLDGATVAKVKILPGDFILGDEDGVIVIPRIVAEPVLVRAEELGRREAEIRRSLSQGMGLQEALSHYGHV